MKKTMLAIFLMVIALCSPALAIEADYVPMSFLFPIASSDAGDAATSTVTFKAPADITLKSIYVTETDGVTANASDSATFNVIDDGTTIQTFTTNTTATALTAMTPKAFTLVTAGNVHRIAKDSVVTVTVGKNGSGVALTTPVIQIDYVIGW